MTEQQFEAEQAAIRKLRIELLRAYTRKLQTAMKRLRPGEASWSEVTGGVRMVIDQLRYEYKQAPPAAGDEHAPPVEAATMKENPFGNIRLKIHTGT